MKKILVLVSVLLMVFLIYKWTNRKEELEFLIGEELYSDARVTDIIIDIERNREINGYPFQRILVKATNITIDLNIFIRLNNHKGVLNQLRDLENLFILLRKYSKERITVIPLTNNSDLAAYTNKKIDTLCETYKITKIVI